VSTEHESAHDGQMGCSVSATVRTGGPMAGAQTRTRTVRRTIRRPPLNAGHGVLARALAAVLGISIIAMSYARERPDEARAGVLVLLIVLWLTVWSLNARSSHQLLPGIASVGWALQVAATMTYYYSDVARDAARFHREATRIVQGGESIVFTAPNWGNEGLLVVLTSIYRVTGSSMLLGFVAFGALGLTGKVLFARAMLTLRPLLGRTAQHVAVAAVVVPSFVWWTGAISKESIVILGMGIVFAALLRPRGAPPHLIGIVVGLAVIALVRAHVTLLLAAAVYVYIVLAFRLPARRGGGRAWLVALGSIVVVGSLLLGTSYLGSDGLGGLEDSRVAIGDRTAEGGSTVVARPIRSPLDVPAAVSVMLFRPFPWEAFSVLTLAQALEGVLLAAVVLWTFRQTSRRHRNPRFGADAAQLRALRWLAITYTGGFTYSFSAVAYNLGLVSRQRSQLWFMLLIALAVSLVSRERGRASLGRTKRA